MPVRRRIDPNRVAMSSHISIVDLEVFYHVGVPEQERAQPQRLLLTIDLDFDLKAAAATDRLEDTINYQAITDHLLRLGEGRAWKLIEKLAGDIAETIIERYEPDSVRVEVKKFVIPQARYVSVTLERAR